MRRTPPAAPAAAWLLACLLPALLTGLLTGCSGGDPPTAPADAATPATSAAPEPADPTASPDPADPADPSQPGADDLAAAVSDPVEDSKYPRVGDPSVDALHYDLDVGWAPGTRLLTGKETLVFRSTTDADHVQLDFAAPLHVTSLELDGEDASYEHTGKVLLVEGDFAADEDHELAIAYSGKPHPVPAPTTRQDFSTTGFTVADDGSAWTMQEPYGAYSWYAVNDQPADKAFYDFTLRVPAPWTGVANGELAARTEEDGQTVTDWHLDSVTSSYLVTVAFGDYGVTEATSSSGVPLSYWIPKSSPQWLEPVKYTAQALDWVEGRLGPYPWSSLGILVVDSDSGMETQSMITLGDTEYTTAKDTIVHEIVHQWYGDRVTPDDWRDLWMNEGMAMYLQFVWQSEHLDIPLEQILGQAATYERISRRVNGPPADYHPQTFGEIQVYYGPALMWDEIRRRVGDEKFWAMVRAWPSSDADGTVSRDGYLPWIEEQTGADLQDLYAGWLFAKRSPRFD